MKVPELDIGKVVEDTLVVVADTVLLGTLQARYNENLPGANQNTNDALAFLHAAFAGVIGSNKDFVGQQVKETFVELFSNLALKSQTQVGHNTRLSYADINTFVKNAVANEGLSLLTKTHSA